jgi:polyisoprenoid-binding protein YceI
MNTKKINAEASAIKWTGKKILGSHDGIINLKEGFFTFEDEKLVGGEFLVDMTSIQVTDLEGETKEQLEGHLKNDDFFGVDQNPEAKMVFKTVQNLPKAHKVDAELTIKGQTHPVNLELELNENGAKTEFKVDRTKYGIRYGSGSFFSNLGDNTIKDHFVLEVDAKF